jgi:hypothetical protein
MKKACLNGSNCLLEGRCSRKPRSSSEGDLLLCEFSRVLLGDIHGAEFSQFPLFNGFNLSTFLVDLLADFSAFFEVVKAVLLGLLVISLDLGAELVGVLLQYFLLFLLNVSLLLLNLLLFLDYAKELITLLLSLFREALLSFKELPLSGILKVSEDLLFVLEIASLLIASLPFTLLEGSLSSKSINLSLTVSSFFLKLSQASDFALLLFLDTL